MAHVRSDRGEVDRGELAAVVQAVLDAVVDGDRPEEIARGALAALVGTLGLTSGVWWEPAAGHTQLVARDVVPADPSYALAIDRNAHPPASEISARMRAWLSGTAQWAERTPTDAGDVLCVPVVHDGRVLAVIELSRATSASPARALVDALQAMASAVGRAMQRARIRATVESSLRASDDKLARLSASDVIGVVVGTHDGYIIDANDAYLRMIQRSRPDLEAGQVRWDLVTPESSRGSDQRAIAQLQSTGVAPVYEKEFLRQDGTRVPVLIGCASLRDNPNAAICFVLDISRQKESERALEALNRELDQRVVIRTAALRASEQRAAEHAAALERSERELRALAARLTSVREDQLAHIAHEIHDDLGQQLTGLTMDIAWATRRLAVPDAEKLRAVVERLGQMAHAIDGMMVAMRRLATELRPRVLDHLGFVAAVESHAQALAARSELAIELELPNELPLPQQVATAMFRIYQELVINVVRHAHATRILVAVQTDEHGIELVVDDDGVGIDPAAMSRLSSLGLVGVRERALALGGTFQIVGVPERGTRAVLRLPAEVA